MRHDPRGRPVKYNVDEGNEDILKEEDVVEDDHDQHELDDHGPEEDVEELIESNDVLSDNVHEDDIDDDMLIITDIDDEDDMANPYNVESGSSDDSTDNDLDE